jgi:hypothetical protein
MSALRTIVGNLLCVVTLYCVFVSAGDCDSEDEEYAGWKVVGEGSDHITPEQKERSEREKDRCGSHALQALRAGRLAHEKSVFISHVQFLPEDVLPEWTLQSVDRYIWKHYDMAEKVRLFRLSREFLYDKKRNAIQMRAHVRICECDSSKWAADSICWVIMNCSMGMSPGDKEIGDVSLWTSSLDSHCYFTRGNISVFVQVFSPVKMPYEERKELKQHPAYMIGVAQLGKDISIRIDKFIQEVEPVDSTDEAAPRIMEFKMEGDGQIDAGQAVEIKLALADPNKKKVSYKIVTTGKGEVFREGQKLYFRSNEPGENTLILQATNEDKLTAKKETKIVVREKPE